MSFNNSSYNQNIDPQNQYTYNYKSDKNMQKSQNSGSPETREFFYNKSMFNNSMTGNQQLLTKQVMDNQVDEENFLNFSPDKLSLDRKSFSKRSLQKLNYSPQFQDLNSKMYQMNYPSCHCNREELVQILKREIEELKLQLQLSNPLEFQEDEQKTLISSLYKDISELKREISTKDDVIQQLNDDNLSVNTKNEILESDQQKLLLEIKHVREESYSLQQKLTKLENIIKDNKKSYAEMQQDNKYYIQKMEEQIKEIANQKQINDELNLRCKSDLEKLQALEESIKQKNAQQQQLQQQYIMNNVPFVIQEGEIMNNNSHTENFSQMDDQQQMLSSKQIHCKLTESSFADTVVSKATKFAHEIDNFVFKFIESKKQRIRSKQEQKFYEELSKMMQSIKDKHNSLQEEMKQMIKQYEDKNNETKATLQAALGHVKVLKNNTEQTLMNLELKCQEQEKKLKQNNEQLEFKNEDLKQQKDKIDTLTAKLKQSDAKIQEQTDNIDQLNDKKKDLEDKLIKKNNKVNQIQQQCDDQQRKIEEIIISKKDLEVQTEVQIMQIKEYQNKIDNLNQEISNFKQEARETQNQLKSLNLNYEKLVGNQMNNNPHALYISESSKEEEKRKKQEIKNQISALKDEIKQLQSNNQQLTNKNQEYEYELQRFQKIASSGRNFEEEAAILNEKNKNLEISLQQHKKENEQMRKELLEVQKRLPLAEKELQDIFQEREQFKIAKANFEQQINQQKTQISELKQQIKFTQEKLEKIQKNEQIVKNLLQNKDIELQDTVTEYQTQIQILQQEKERLEHSLMYMSQVGQTFDANESNNSQILEQSEKNNKINAQKIKILASELDQKIKENKILTLRGKDLEDFIIMLIDENKDFKNDTYKILGEKVVKFQKSHSCKQLFFSQSLQDSITQQINQKRQIQNENDDDNDDEQQL